MTSQEYIEQLKSFTVSKMEGLPKGPHHLRFWTDFNRQCKEEFDAQLASQGIIVEE